MGYNTAMLPVPRLRTPIVLVHGLFGFDRLRLGPVTLFEYFRAIPDVLRSGGNRVLVPCLSPFGGVVARAAQLKQAVDRASPHEPVHLIAHSLGGLDGRYLITRLGMADRVLSLTTVGTPHRGSPFADWAVRPLAPFVRPILDGLQVPYQAFFDLTVARCRRFNEEVPDASGVRYFSVAGDLRLSWRSWNWWLPARVVERAEGPNDGVVSLASAAWGETREVWDADHMELVNWPRPLAPRSRSEERVAGYVQMVRRLADEGF
jgi:triacylglycerol lipase